MAGFDDRNVIPLFISRYEELFSGSWAMDLSLYMPNSKRGTETYGLLGGYPKMREWIGARNAQITAQRSYSIRNLPYESSLIVPERQLSRDQTGLLTRYIGGFAQNVVANQWEDLITQLINTNGNAYDGNAFFGTTHQFGSETAQKNQVTNSDVAALDVAVATAPTPTEMAASVMGLVAYMMQYTDNQGRFMNQNAREFTVAVSTGPLFTALTQALSNNLLQGLLDNPLKGFTIAGFKFKPLYLPALTGATAKVRIFRTDGELKPFILQQEQDIEYNLLGRGSDFYFENKAIKLGVDASRGAGYGLFEYAIEGTLS